MRVNRGRLLTGAGDLPSALLVDAMALARQRCDRSRVAQRLLAQAGAPLHGGAPAAALALLRQALAEAVAARAQPLVALAHERLSLANEAVADLQAALRHVREFHAASQRLRDELQAQTVLLQQLAREDGRASDVLGRYGGEALLLVLAQTAGAPAPWPVRQAAPAGRSP